VDFVKWWILLGRFQSTESGSPSEVVGKAATFRTPPRPIRLQIYPMSVSWREVVVERGWWGVGMVMILIRI
jgi:hypothetical protein